MKIKSTYSLALTEYPSSLVFSPSSVLIFLLLLLSVLSLVNSEDELPVIAVSGLMSPWRAGGREFSIRVLENDDFL